MSDLESSNEKWKDPELEVETRQSTPPESFNWPDVRKPHADSNSGNDGHSKDLGFQRKDIEVISMDYSLAYFIKAVSEQTPPPREVGLLPDMAWEAAWKSEHAPSGPFMRSQVQPIPQGIWSS